MIPDTSPQGMTAEQVRVIYQEQADSDLRALLANETGRRMLWTLINERLQGGLFGTTFAFGQDTHAMAYREGRRSIGVELFADCQRLSPADAARMLAEAFNRRAQMTAAEKTNG